MTDDNLVYGAAAFGAVWWWLKGRKCDCPDAKPGATTTIPAPPPPPPAPPPPIDSRPEWVSPICPAGYEPSEGGSCARNVVETIPGYPAPIARVDFATATCPPGYASDSGSCHRS